MITGQQVLGIIPARGASKGVPRKNIRIVGGRPLIAWTIDAARQSKYLDRVVVSTDDTEIAEVARGFGADVPFLRSAELAADDTPGIEPVLHAVDLLPDHDYIVLLQPTSPLRTAEDIDGCIELCVSSKAPAAASVCRVEKSPYWMYTLERDAKMRPLLDKTPLASCRQDLPPVYVLNGAVYVAGTRWLKNAREFVTADTAGYVMPCARSLDIDTELDLKIADALLREKYCA